ncbi:hypothetical protein ULMS_28290 [Patiriisocius marinistellae]|uniref:Uncharacterized protein n=1 Tax=Patiriisocius marinistellae TaxID=2494560 RepID=A0A5J4G482_9FLAO|nr:hypothetical protein ULMS_28290 [Patiriisocius marinistellae]
MALWGALEFFYRTTETNYTYKTAKLIENYDCIETLILGDSHTFYGLDPEYFTSKTFNLANISQTLYFDELLLEKHIDSMDSLKTVILNVSYFSLSSLENSKEDSWRKYFYEAQMDLDVPIVSSFAPQKYSLALARRLHKSLELTHQYHDNGTIVNCYKNGYGIQDENDIVTDKENISIFIAKKHEDGLLDFKNNTVRLQRMIALCQNRNVKVLLIEMPVYPTYYDLLDQEKWSKIETTLHLLAKEHQNTDHLDLTQHSTFNKEDLRDADHLTNNGAKKCSRLVDDYLKATL